MTQLQEPPTHLHRNDVRHAHSEGWSRHTHDLTTGSIILYPSKEKPPMSQPQPDSTTVKHWVGSKGRTFSVRTSADPKRYFAQVTDPDGTVISISNTFKTVTGATNWARRIHNQTAEEE